MMIIFGVPRLARRVLASPRGVMGLSLSGVFFGPHVLYVCGSLFGERTSLVNKGPSWISPRGLGKAPVDVCPPVLMLNVVLVLVLTTATLGLVLTERFAPRMLEDSYSRKTENA